MITTADQGKETAMGRLHRKNNKTKTTTLVHSTLKRGWSHAKYQLAGSETVRVGAVRNHMTK